MKRVHKTAGRGFDTTSQDQPQTKAPIQTQSPLPHERDESARKTGKHEKPPGRGAASPRRGVLFDSGESTQR